MPGYPNPVRHQATRHGVLCLSASRIKNSRWVTVRQRRNTSSVEEQGAASRDLHKQSMSAERRLLPRISWMRRLAARAGNPLEWCNTDKVVLASVLTLPFIVVWGLRYRYLMARPEEAPYMDPAVVPLMLLFLEVAAGGFLFMIGLGLLLRRRYPESRPLVYLANQFWYAFYGLGAYAVGPYTSPFGALVLVGPMVGFLLFDRRPAFLGFLTFILIQGGTTIAERLGAIPYAPLLATQPFEDGRLANAWFMSVGLASTAGFVVLVVIYVYIIGQWRDREARINELSKTDHLTKLNNRRHFMEVLELEFLRTKRYRTALALVLTDLDHFKNVNDQYGHLVGDEVLVAVAEILRTNMRHLDTVARYGGEEFILLLPETTLEGAAALAERFRKKIAETSLELTGGESLSVSASFGVTAIPNEEVGDVDDLIRIADGALYRAKNDGRNRVAVAG